MASKTVKTTKKPAKVQEETEKVDRLNPWDFIRLMEKGEYDPTEHDKYYHPYMLSRVLSTDTKLIPALNAINLYNTLPQNVHFQYCQSLVKMVGRVYSSYAKEGLNVNKKSNKVKDCIMTFFDFGENDYDNIIGQLTDEQVDEIVEYCERFKLCEVS